LPRNCDAWCTDVQHYVRALTTSRAWPIFTPVQVKVETVLRGSDSGKTVTVRVFGGQIGT